jgi:hypothetical protein
MTIFSFHLVRTPFSTTLKAFFRPPKKNQIAGLRHAEFLAAMTLGAPILSSARMQLHNLGVFAYWENESALDAFLMNSELGSVLSSGWHVRLRFLRRWGHFSAIEDLPTNVEDTDPTKPVVAVTLARLKLPELFRFIRWGKPVEEQVRDHPGTTLALAAFRPLRTFSTFSIWKSQQLMTDMVHGKGSFPGALRHAEAMVERERKDFHHEFITLRFRALSEHGQWLGRGNFVPE